MAEPVLPIWIPVGIPLGYWYYEGLDLDDPEARVMAQRFGKLTLGFPVATYFVWDSSFERHDREGIIELAESRKVDKAEARFDELIDTGRIINLNGDFEYVSSLMDQYRMMPSAVGIGNNRANLYQYEIGLPHHPRIVVHQVAYSVWSICNSEPTLLQACKQIAEDQHDELEPVVTLMAQVLPAMLAARVVFMDDA